LGRSDDDDSPEKQACSSASVALTVSVHLNFGAMPNTQGHCSTLSRVEGQYAVQCRGRSDASFPLKSKHSGALTATIRNGPAIVFEQSVTDHKYHNVAQLNHRAQVW
jgi:hypothetical protein